MGKGKRRHARYVWVWMATLAGAAAVAGCPPPGGPTLTNVTPSPAEPGAIVTLAGTGFGATQGTSAVLYDGAPLAIFSWSDTEILAALPNPKPADFYEAAVQVGAATSNAVEHRICPAEGCPFQVHHLTYTVNPNNILSGFLDFQTDVPATPAVTIDGPQGSFVVPPTGILSASPGTTHQVGVLGLRQGTAYTFRVTAEDPGTMEVAPERTAPHTTGSLDPEKFALMVLIHDPANMAPGYTFFRVSSPNAAGGFNTLFAIDQDAELVWYHDAPSGHMEVLRHPDGTLVYNRIGNIVEKIDMYGNILSTITAAQLGTDTIHHELTLLPNGNYLTLSTEARMIAGYPGGSGPFTFNVVGDIIVEFTPEGTIVDEWSNFDVLDPFRTKFEFDDTTWWGVYGPFAKDWTHGNAVIYDPSDDTFIFSPRHQDAVFKLTRDHPQEIVWVIGEDEIGTPFDDAWPFLDLQGPGSYLNHQHAPEILPDGNILIYDNANFTQITRAVEFELDVPMLTMTQPWEWIDPDYNPPLFARFVGDVDRLPNGNILYFDGGLEGDPDPVLNPHSIRVVEVRRDTSEKVFEAWMYGDDLDYIGYRAMRLPTLYPP